MHIFIYLSTPPPPLDAQVESIDMMIEKALEEMSHSDSHAFVDDIMMHAEWAIEAVDAQTEGLDMQVKNVDVMITDVDAAVEEMLSMAMDDSTMDESTKKAIAAAHEAVEGAHEAVEVAHNATEMMHFAIAEADAAIESSIGLEGEELMHDEHAGGELTMETTMSAEEVNKVDDAEGHNTSEMIMKADELVEEADVKVEQADAAIEAMDMWLECERTYGNTPL